MAASKTQKKTRENKKINWTKKKIVAAAIIGVAILAAIIFAVIVIVNGLGRVRPIKSSEQEATVVGECAGFDVRYEELRYVTIVCRAELDRELGAYDSLDLSEQEIYEKALEAKVFEKLKENYSVLALAEEMGIKTDSYALKREVQKAIEKFVNENCNDSVEEYKTALASMNMTDSLLRFVYKVDIVEGQILDKLIEDGDRILYSIDEPESVVDFTEYVVNGGDYARTIHAYYPKTSQYIDASESLERAKATAAALAAEENDEARYSMMCSAIGSAPFVPGFSLTNDGVYFTRGQMGEAYESAAFALEYFGTSEVVETADGYYVIMRLEPEIEGARKRVNELLAQYQYSVLYSLENEQKDNIEFVPNEKFESIKLIDIK